MTRARYAIPPILILLLAAGLRLTYPGLWTTWGDELNIINAALDIATRGDWVWVGNESSFGALAAHSPLSIWITARMAGFAPHPMAIRLFYGLWDIVTVALTFATVRKHIGYPAALVAMSLIAVMPLPVYWSRFVWNPNLAPLFLILWFGAAADGYTKGDHWSQIRHWLSLALAIHMQSALVMLVPISLGLTVFAFAKTDSRPKFIQRHLIAAVIILITLFPWGYGLYGINQGWWHPPLGVGNYDSGTLELKIPTIERIMATTALLTASAGYWGDNLRSVSDAPVWWFPSWANWILNGQAIAILIGALYLAWKKSTWYKFLLVAITLPLGLLLLDRWLSNFYFMSTVYGAIIIAGWCGQWLVRRWRWTAIFIAGVVAVQLWLTLSMMSWEGEQDSLWTYGEVVQLVDMWHANQYDVLVWEFDPGASEIESHKWRTHWQILGDIYPVRYLTDPHAVPIAPEQKLILTTQSQTWHDNLVASETFTNPERSFTSYQISPDDFPPLTVFPVADNQFGNLARITGLSIDALAGETANIVLHWHPLKTADTVYQFSLRLVDAEGNILSQRDQTSLDPALWQAGDTVISFVEMPLPQEPLPEQIQFDLVLYRLDTGAPVNTESGNPIMPLR